MSHHDHNTPRIYVSLLLAVSIFWLILPHASARVWVPTTKAADADMPASSGGVQSDGVANESPVLSSVPQGSAYAVKRKAAAAFTRLSLSFEANQGQTDPQVSFLTHGAGYNLFLTPTRAVLCPNKNREDARQTLPDKMGTQPGRSARRKNDFTAISMRLLGGNPHPRVLGTDELPGKTNYFIGNDPIKWRTGVPSYAGVEYQSVYPGIDLIYKGNQQELEYDFAVAPGADPKVIAFHFNGAERIEIDAQGDLVLHVGPDQIRHHKPLVYQVLNGVKNIVEGGYVLAGGKRIGFQIADYDTSQPLIIDPTVSLSYSTYLGGAGTDKGNGIAVDSFGDAYVTGYTDSTVFPTKNPYQIDKGAGIDAFITKLAIDKSNGQASPVYSTYFGGDGNDQANAIAVDSAGDAYITGFTSSSNLYVPGAFQSARADGSSLSDAFVTVLNATGSGVLYSTYLGGRADDDGGADVGNAIAVDDNGNAYVAGETGSIYFPTSLAPQPILQRTFADSGSSKRHNDAFIAKLSTKNTGRASLVYSTYLGGYESDECHGIAIDSAGNAYLTGLTNSVDDPKTTDKNEGFPLKGLPQPIFHGVNDAFVAKLNAIGDTLIYFTYLGGSQNDIGNGIALDTSGNAYVTGSTTSFDFPVLNPLQTTHGGGNDGNADAFVTKLDRNGRPAYSTYLGGSSGDMAYGIAVDSGGNAYITGATSSGDFLRNLPQPNPYPPFQSVCANCSVDTDAFVAKLKSDGSALAYASFVGGRFKDEGRGIAVDAVGNAYLTGITNSDDDPASTTVNEGFPLVNAFQVKCGGCGESQIVDAFVTKFSLEDISDIPTITNFTPAGALAGTKVSIAGTKFTSSATVSFNGANSQTVTFNSSTSITATIPDCATTGPISVMTAGGTGRSASNFTVLPSAIVPTITSFAPTSAPVGTPVTVTGTNFACPASVSFNGMNSPKVTFNSPTSITATVPDCATTGRISVTVSGGKATSVGSFTVTKPAGAPAITTFTPTSGPALRTLVTIYGMKFTGATSVRFNGEGASFTLVSDTKITATVPRNATSGRICVTTPAGTGTSLVNFTLASLPPTISSFFPTSGQVGTVVTITGTNLLGVTAVRFNGLMTTFVGKSSSSITTTVPVGATTGRISVTTSTGVVTSAGSFVVLNP